VAREFHATYPNAFEYIGAFVGNDRSVTKWNASTLLYGRYELKLRIPIEFDHTHREVTFYDAPQFHINEITKVENMSGERLKIHYGSELQFGAEEWGKLYRADGRLEKVFDSLRTDAPAPGIELYKERRELQSREL